MKNASPRRISSIEVGFRLVRVLEAADGPLSIKELAQRSGMPASKAYTYVASFVHERLFKRDEATGHYGLGPFSISLGVAALRQSDLIVLVRREAAALSEATTCSVLLSMWGNRGPAIVYAFDGKRREPTSFRVGFVLPVWRSATGRVFVTFLPERETAGLLELEEGPRFDRAAVAQEVARIRTAGYALTSEGDELSGISAPILDFAGHIAGALTLSRPYEDNTRAHRLELGRVLRATADEISKQLGHQVELPKPRSRNS